jgi:hypothetical protein
MEYERTTPRKDRSAKGVWKAMNDAEASLVKSIKNKDFHKYLSVANPKHGEGFFEEVRALLCLYYECFHSDVTISLYLELELRNWL